ncbi:MAG: hypothetical protein ACM3KM_03060 [Acidobacteriaceae bacterium]
MRIIAIIVIVALLLGAGYWIYRVVKERQNKAAEVTQSIAAFNQSKNADATTVAAQPRDVIVYTMTVENKSNKVASGYEVSVDISDISQKATLIDAQGANYDSANNSLVWTPLDVPANGSFEKNFTVRIKDSLPAEANPTMTANFGNEVSINLEKTVATVTPAPTPTPTTVTPKPTTPATPAVKPATTTPKPLKAPVTGNSGLLVATLAGAITLGFVLRKLRA